MCFSSNIINKNKQELRIIECDFAFVELNIFYGSKSGYFAQLEKFDQGLKVCNILCMTCFCDLCHKSFVFSLLV